MSRNTRTIIRDTFDQGVVHVREAQRCLAEITELCQGRIDTMNEFIPPVIAHLEISRQLYIQLSEVFRKT